MSDSDVEVEEEEEGVNDDMDAALMDVNGEGEEELEKHDLDALDHDVQNGTREENPEVEESEEAKALGGMVSMEFNSNEDEGDRPMALDDTSRLEMEPEPTPAEVIEIGDSPGPTTMKSEDKQKLREGFFCDFVTRRAEIENHISALSMKLNNAKKLYASQRLDLIHDIFSNTMWCCCLMLTHMFEQFFSTRTFPIFNS